jgi:hypothetical protein
MAPLPANLADPGSTVRSWHLPVFFLGLLTLASVFILRPWIQRGSEERQLERRLSEARRLLERREVELETILELTQSARDRAIAFPQFAGQAFFLSGSAYLRLAEHESAPPVSENARLAASHLEQAEALGVPDADRPRLEYRLGKAWYLANHEPSRIVECWKDSIPDGADDPAEAYDLLSRVYLRLPEPNVEAALAANGKLLQLPLDAETILSPARLFRGELFLRLHQPDAAREVLKKVGVNAPPGLAAQARFLRAGCLEEEGAWMEALKLWEEVRSDKAAPAKRPELVLYHIGLCHRTLDEVGEAAKAWEECLRGAAGSDAGPAAALGLAGLRLLKNHNPQAALEDYSRAVRDVNGPGDWQNSLVSLNSVREEIESGCHILRETHAYSFAIQLANLYEKLAPAGKAQELRGAAARQWARDRLEAARKPGADSADRAAWAEEAQSYFRQAGEAYAKAADLTPAPADQADRLWLSATCYLDGQDPARAVPALEHLLKLDAPAERIGEAWLRLGEAEGALHKDSASQTAYTKAAEYPGRGAAPARFHLAQAAIAKGDFAVAEPLLDENVDPANKDVNADIAEKSLFVLGYVHLKRRSLQSAILRLEQAMREYPASAEMNQARFDLAECFRLLAQQAADSRDEAILAATRDFNHKQFKEYLGKAAGQYQELADDLSTRAARQLLTPDEEERYRLAAFASAQCRFLLGRFEESCKLYEGLAARYHDQAEELHALAGIAQCWWAKNDNKKAASAVQSLEKALRELDDSRFSKEPGAWDRKKWQAWIKETSRPVGQP